METMVQKYDKDIKALAQPIGHKVKRFLDLGCIKKISYNRYECAPIPGYNRTTYVIIEDFGNLFCNCQGFSKKKTCSHAQAVRIYKDRTEHSEKQMSLF